MGWDSMGWDSMRWDSVGVGIACYGAVWGWQQHWVVVSKHVGHIQGMYTGKPMSQLI